jgi:hypothetical protein
MKAYSTWMRAMTEMREATTGSREVFRRELTKGRSLGFFLLLGTAVAIANLLFIYEEHSIRDAVIGAVLWMIVYPLIGYWRYSRKSR